MARGKRHPSGQTEKACTVCGLVKPLTAFYPHKHSTDGRYSNCKECAKQIRRDADARNRVFTTKRSVIRMERRRRMNMEAVWRYLSTHPCVDCGEADPIVLEFDHVYGDKIDSVAQMIARRTWATIAAEIEKCEVRCANCHTRKTARQFNWYGYLGRDHDQDAREALAALKAEHSNQPRQEQ